MDTESTGINNREGYCGGIILLHWLMLLLFIGVYVCVEAHEFFPEDSRTSELLVFWHFQLGYAIFALVCLRLLFRLASKVPLPIHTCPS